MSAVALWSARRALRAVCEPVTLAIGTLALRDLRERLACDAVDGGRQWGDRVWIHTASVGEASSASPLIHALLVRDPTLHVIWSVQTRAGRRLAADVCGALAPRERARVRVRYAPLDIPGVPERALRRAHAGTVVFVETEIWPAWIAAAIEASCRVAWVSARMGDGSRMRYARLRAVLAPLLSHCALVAAQTHRDADAFRDLGAPSERTRVVGSLKVDASAGDPPADVREALRGRSVLVAGSTRPGEEAEVLDAWAQIARQVPDAVLVLAPRHLDRVRAVADLCRARGRECVLRSSMGSGGPRDVLLLDTHGELASLYSLADVAILGGSIAEFGGHNPLEAARAGVPIVCGDHTESCAEVIDELVRSGGARRAAGAPALAEACVHLLRDGNARAAASAAARRTAMSARGVTDRLVDLLVECGAVSARRPAA